MNKHYLGYLAMTSSTVEALLKRREQLDNRIQNLRTREKSQQRKNETRMKILAGAYLLEKHEKEGTFLELVSAIDGFLYREKDRAIFGLKPREKDNSKKDQKDVS
jgi:hypothetical protein